MKASSSPGAGGDGQGGWRAALPPLLITLVLALLFADVLVGGRTLYFRDIYNNHLPLKSLQAAQVLAGQVPLWNPALSGGQPLLANLNLFTFHPSTLLFLVVDPVTAVNWTVFLQLLLAGIGSFLLARRLGWGEAGALFAAIAFTLSGYMLSLGNLLNMLNSAAWLPLTAWLFLGWRATRSPLRGLACVFSLTIQLLGGDPGMVLATLLLITLLAFHRPGEGGPAPARDLAALAGVSLAAAGLAGLQLLPFVELLQQTVRGWGFTLRGLTFWSTHPLRLLELHLPAFFGDVNSTAAGDLWGHRLFDDGFPLILSIYAGQAVLFFALAALLRWRRDRDAVLLGLLLAAGLLLSLGGHTPLYALLHKLPVVGGMRFPSRFMVLVTLALALLGGKAFGRLADGRQEGSRLAARLGLGGMAWSLAAAIFFAGTMISGGWVVELVSRAAAQSVDDVLRGAVAGLLQRGLLAQLILFATAFLTWAAARGRMPRALFAGVVLAVLAVDLCLFGAGVNFRTDRTFFTSVPPAAEAIRSDAGHSGLVRVFREDKPAGFRIDPPAKEKEWICLWDRSLLTPPSGVSLGLGYDLGVATDLLSPRSTCEAARRMFGGSPADRRRMLDLSAVTYVLGFDEGAAPGLATVFRTDDFSTVTMSVRRNPGALPRARLVATAVTAGDGDVFDAVLDPGFDPHRQVVLRGLAKMPAEPGGDARAPGRCRIVEDRPGRVVLEVAPAGPSWLVLADTWYPGWRAEVGGEERPILEANGLHRAVRVGPGDREVVMTYRPRSWLAGRLVSLATALILAVCFGHGQLRRRGSLERG